MTMVYIEPVDPEHFDGVTMLGFPTRDTGLDLSTLKPKVKLL